MKTRTGIAVVSGLCLVLLSPIALKAACTAGPVGNITVSPNEVWSPGGRPAEVTVEGRFTHGSDCSFIFGRMNVVDEYNEIHQSANVVLEADGSFRSTFMIESKVDRRQRDFDGRTYRIVVGVRNQAGVAVADTTLRSLHHPERGGPR